MTLARLIQLALRSRRRAPAAWGAMKRTTLALSVLLAGCFDIDALTHPRPDLSGRDLGTDADGSTCTGPNVLKNPGAEEGLTDWTRFQVSDVITTDARSGSNAFDVQPTAPDEGGLYQAPIHAYDGEHFCATLWTKTLAGTPPTLLVYETDAGGNEYPGGLHLGAAADPASPDWQRLSVDVDVTRSEVTLKIEAHVTAPLLGTRFLVDDFSLSRAQ